MFKSLRTYTKFLGKPHTRNMSIKVFNEDMKLIQRDAAAKNPDFKDYDYVRTEFSRRVMDRLSFIQKGFPKVLEFGSGNGAFSTYVANKHAESTSDGYIKPSMSVASAMSLDPANTAAFEDLSPEEQEKARNELLNAMDIIDKYSLPDVQAYTVYDSSEASAQNATQELQRVLDTVKNTNKRFAVHTLSGPLDTVDLKQHGPYDLVVSNLYMHWINDLPGVFTKVLDAMNPNGVFIGCLLGGETLRELRSSFTLAELERIGGVQNHISPFTLPKDIGDLMTGAGFQLVSVDIDRITVQYPDMFTLIEHIQGMGESHAPVVPQPTNRDIFLSASSIYDTMYKDPDNGMLNATIDVVMFIGWKHDPETMTPTAKRGSATHKLGDQINTTTVCNK